MLNQPRKRQNSATHKKNGGNPKPRSFCNYISRLKQRVWRETFDIIDALKELSGLLVAIATFLLAWIAFWQWGALEKTDRTLNNSFIAANRAWIAPVGINMGLPKPGEPIQFNITFQNIGKGPALAVDWTAIGAYHPIPPNNDGARLAIEPNITCHGLMPNPNGATEFPAIRQTLHQLANNTGMQKPPLVADQDMFDDKHRFYARGCIVYSTTDLRGWTQFCFSVLWKHDATTGQPLLNEGKPVYEYYACPGSAAG